MGLGAERHVGITRLRAGALRLGQDVRYSGKCQTRTRSKNICVDR